MENKIICAHRGFFDKESEKTFRENSLEVCKISGSRKEIQLIELDVRKSKDGVVYCYHGNMLQYWIILKFPSLYHAIQKKYNVSTLQEILTFIPKDKIIFLDLKDRNLTKEDILKAVGGKQFKEIILGNKSVSFLGRFIHMPNQYVKALNGNMFSIFYNFKRLQEDNFRYVEIVFPFLVNKNIIDKIHTNGLEFIGSPAVIFRSKESYWKMVKRYNVKFIGSDFI